MGFFDSAKNFLGGSSMVDLQFTSLERQDPNTCSFPRGDSVFKGQYLITAQKKCTVLRHVHQFCTRLPEKDGTLGSVLREDVNDVNNQVIGLPYKWPYDLAQGQQVEGGFLIGDIDVPGSLARLYGLGALDPRVEFFVRVIVDVKGSPFDPTFEKTFRVV
jgi:hypothetical protein